MCANGGDTQRLMSIIFHLNPTFLCHPPLTREIKIIEMGRYNWQSKKRHNAEDQTSVCSIINIKRGQFKGKKSGNTTIFIRKLIRGHIAVKA